MMTSAIEHKAFQLVRKLRKHGCKPQSPKRTPRSALINIEQPTPEMAKQAIEIKQCLNGVFSLVYTLQVDGCTVSWQQGEQQCNLH